MNSSDISHERKDVEPTGSLAIALRHGGELLERDPALAAEQASAILEAMPGQRDARLLLAVALRRQGDPAGVVAALEKIVADHAGWAEAHFELGLAFGSAGQGKKAIRALERAVSVDADLTNAWRALGNQLLLAGDQAGAEGAKMAIRAGVRSIEHGSLLDRDALSLMKKRGVWLIADVYNGDYIDEVRTREGWPAETMRKNRETTDAQRAVFRQAVEMGVKIAFGDDVSILLKIL